jgi:hypothetical protein
MRGVVGAQVTDRGRGQRGGSTSSVIEYAW